jgi:hypothetical protein
MRVFVVPSKHAFHHTPDARKSGTEFMTFHVQFAVAAADIPRLACYRIRCRGVA